MPRHYCASFSDGVDCQAELVERGDRMLVWCEGGPSIGRAVRFPPPLDLEADGGIYVLVDDGPPESWRYEFIAVAP